jgi:hypothetical protein
MFHVLVLLAFFCAGKTDIRAFIQQVLCVFGTPGYKGNGQRADLRAVHVEPDAPCQHFYIFFFQAGGCTMAAFLCAFMKGFEQGPVFFMTHNPGFNS